MSLTVQFQTMFAMIVMGTVIGINIDVYHRLTLTSIRTLWMRAVWDIVFWLAQALLVFYVLLHMNEGELRIYVYLALLFGFLLYRKSGRRTFLKIMEKTIAFFQWMWRTFCGVLRVLIVLPIKFILKQLTTLGMIGITLIISLLKLLSNILLFPLKVAGRLLFPIFKRFVPAIVVTTIKKYFYILRYWGKRKK